MGKLEVIFKVRLAYPSGPSVHPIAKEGVLRNLADDLDTRTPAVIHFLDTGNTVRVGGPHYGPDIHPNYKGWDQMILRVERECTNEQGQNASASDADDFRINQDAAKAFWQVFEAIRDAALRWDRTFFPPLPYLSLRNSALQPVGTDLRMRVDLSGKVTEKHEYSPKCPYD